MDKCREAFEKLPEIKNSLSENIVFVGNKYTTANEGFYDLVNWLNGGWYTWQSRQAEVDEYKEVSESMEDAYLREKAKVDELRKRIDEAIAMADESCGVNIPAFIKLNKILKGIINE